VVQIHVRAPVSKPLCLSSYRASFVNSYSSVRVRPEAPFYQGRDVTVSISACDADCAGANPVALTIFTPVSKFKIFSHFGPVRRESGSPLESSCSTLVQSRFESARWLRTNSMAGDGRNPAPKFGTARPARKRSPMPALRKSRKRFSRRQTVACCLGLSNL
jgi:hypothetical protein